MTFAVVQINGYHLNVKNKDLEFFTLKVAVSKIELSEIADWLRKKVSKGGK